MSAETFDVVIFGAGTAGCATALALKAAGIADIAIVAADASLRDDWVGESLPPDVTDPLKTLGLWDAFRQDGHEPCFGSCTAWGSSDLGYNDFLPNVKGSGWHIHRPRFNALLRGAVSGLGIPIHSRQRMTDVESLALEGGLRLSLRTEAGERAVVTRHVVDATGPRGAFARRMGARSRRHDLLVFLTATATLAPGRWGSRLTMTETVADGWWYAAALPGNRLSLAFATDPAISRGKRLNQPAEWLKALGATRHIGPRLTGTPFRLGPLLVRAVPVSQLDRPSGTRWIAVGDAAAVFDPLGSEGIYKALKNGIYAAQVLRAKLGHDQDLSGDYAASILADAEDHLALRDHFYGLERQWPESFFWTKRLRPQWQESRRAL